MMSNHISDSVRAANCFSADAASTDSCKIITRSLVFYQITAAPLRAGLDSLTAVPHIRTFPQVSGYSAALAVLISVPPIPV